jgi:hypothetical protein
VLAISSDGIALWCTNTGINTHGGEALIMADPPKRKVSLWVNVYRDVQGGYFPGSTTYATREEAEQGGKRLIAYVTSVLIEFEVAN